MNFQLNGRTALVTGSSRGIGKAIAIALAKEGCHLYLCARNAEGLEKTCQEIRKVGHNAFYHCLDATNPKQIKNFFDNFKDNLDILVNNIGGGTEKTNKLFEISEEDWLETYKLNVLSTMWFTQYALPFLENSTQARIINIGSATSHQPGFNNPHYGAAKSALDHLTKRLANELAPKGICVNVIGPHALLGETWERDVVNRAKIQNLSLEKARETMTKEALAKIPLGRQGTHEDVANLVVFLASSRANFITGTYIPVDGGTFRAIP
ncbi:MAG: SDR family oxidoreductase [bacterium]|nr:SDR family oxidoreductase [bacterium]